jgi:hypothetical protein
VFHLGHYFIRLDLSCDFMVDFNINTPLLLTTHQDEKECLGRRQLFTQQQVSNYKQANEACKQHMADCGIKYPHAPTYPPALLMFLKVHGTKEEVKRHEQVEAALASAVESM